MSSNASQPSSVDDQQSQCSTPLTPHIFTCTICFRPVSEVYSSCESSKNQSPKTRFIGLRDGSTATQPFVLPAKVWFFLDCRHLVCSEHLLGGGVPFYPAGRDPKAVCPVCVKHCLEDGIESVAVPLYTSQIGELDPRIPKELFAPPEFEPGAKDPYVFDITKFQYENLLRFAAFKVRETKIYEGRKEVAGALPSEIEENDGDYEMAAIPSPTSSLKNDLREEEAAEDAAKCHYISPVSIASQSVNTGPRSICVNEPQSDDDDDNEWADDDLQEWQPYPEPNSRTFLRRNSSSSSKPPAAPHCSERSMISPHTRPAVESAEVKGNQLQPVERSPVVFEKPLLSYRRRQGSPLFPPPKRQRQNSRKSATTITLAPLDVQGSSIPFSAPNIRARRLYSKEVPLQSAGITLLRTPTHRLGLPVNPPTERTKEIDEVSQKPVIMPGFFGQPSKDWLGREYGSSHDVKKQVNRGTSRAFTAKQPAFISDLRISERHTSKSSSAKGRRKTGDGSRTRSLAMWL